MSDPHGATPLPVDWANALRAVVEPLCAAQGTKKMGESLYKELLRCVQNLRDGELRTHQVQATQLDAPRHVAADARAD